MFSDSMMLGGGRKAAFSIANSVRLDGVADYFTRTFGSPTAQGRWAFSLWFKRSQIGLSDRRHIFGGNSLSDSSRFAVFIDTNDSLRLDWGGESSQIVSSRKFRDVSAWYHLVMSFDGTASANQDRLRIWINGQRETDFAAFNASIPATVSFNHVTQHFLGSEGGSGYFPGYFADVGFIDGAALDPSAFGETDPVTGSWRPKPIGNLDFGTNGFHLDFADGADVGNDVSGMGNAWLPVSLGAADVVADSPTNNFATWNVVEPGRANFSNGGLTVTSNSPDYWHAVGSMGVSSGKWYFEVTPTAGSGWRVVGVSSTQMPSTSPVFNGAGNYGYVSHLGSTRNNGVTSAYGDSYASGDVIGVALDLDGGKLWFAKNNTWQASGDPVAGVNAAFTGLAGTFFPCLGDDASGGVQAFTANFGQRAFAHTPPAGFKSLCTANMPKPAIQAPAKHMNVVTYTGNGTVRSVGGLDFQPDFVWLKSRSQAYGHIIVDSVRGATKYLIPNSTQAEDTGAHVVSSLDPDGFTLGSDVYVNSNGSTNVAWCWKAGGAAVSNTDGTIASLVSANPTAGFSVVAYTGDGAGAASFGHGLGAVPKMVIIKSRGEVRDWPVYHAGLTSAANILYLNSTLAQFALRSFNDTAPTSTVVNIHWNSGVNHTNKSGDTFVAYCWAEVPGFSKFGSYIGNGSTDGPFVYCGFRPRWIMVKRVNLDSHWFLWDSVRDSSNPSGGDIFTDTAQVESADQRIDIVSNGFKLRSSIGVNDDTFIYAAFAEHPLGGAKTVPAKAR